MTHYFDALDVVTRGDCVPWLQAMPANSAHCAIFDPPYCSGDWQESKQARRISIGDDEGERDWFVADSMGTAGLVFLLRTVMMELHRVLVPGGHAFTFAAWRPALVLAPALESSGMRLLNWLVWDKRTAGQGEHFRTQHETILHYCKGTARRCAGAGKLGNVLAFSRVHHAHRVHPTPKPVDLLDRLVEVGSDVGEIVLDPFAGTGPSGQAARRNGRRWHGCELDPVYAAFARSRVLDEPSPEIAGQTGFTFRK